MKQLFLSLILVFAVVCSAEEENVAVPDSIKNVKTKHETELMATPGVVSVGIGQDNKGQSIIIIGVESQEILNKITLPQELDGYPLKVQILGTIRAQ